MTVKFPNKKLVMLDQLILLEKECMRFQNYVVFASHPFSMADSLQKTAEELEDIAKTMRSMAKAFVEDELDGDNGSLE